MLAVVALLSCFARVLGQTASFGDKEGTRFGLSDAPADADAAPFVEIGGYQMRGLRMMVVNLPVGDPAEVKKQVESKAPKSSDKTGRLWRNSNPSIADFTRVKCDKREGTAILAVQNFVTHNLWHGMSGIHAVWYIYKQLQLQGGADAIVIGHGDGRGAHECGGEELEATLPRAMAVVGPAILHVRIDPQGQRKKQEFGFDPTGVLAKRALAKKRKELEQAVAQSKL